MCGTIGSRFDVDLLDRHELRLWRALGFEVEFDRLTNVGERLLLRGSKGVAAREDWDVGDERPRLVLFDHDVELHES
jgi:hypothetical protein